MTRQQAARQVADYEKKRAAAINMMERTFGKEAVVPLEVAAHFLPEVPRAMMGYPIAAEAR